ncbi:hypothetical protein NE619_16960 [Anaerovorax odorimutans]|uniref:Uncharacterized protein n=1 Tax=Anaerovorax odorimutans TaxID=109327 RepID=A0ABT1RTB6_9FIRM|nr:hypothetical protein [Anaerovorax odorimutans]MCQ4638423.1 hypothetical protein [Anaerovorax odorimutans]
MNAKNVLIKIIKVLIAAVIILMGQHFLGGIGWGMKDLDGYPWSMELARLIKNTLYGCILVIFIFDNVEMKQTKYNLIPLILLGLFSLVDLLFYTRLIAVTPYFILIACTGNSMYFQIPFGIWLALMIKGKIRTGKGNSYDKDNGKN